jgi:uncharacterized protein YoxC
MFNLKKIIFWVGLIGVLITLIVLFFNHYGKLRDDLTIVRENNKTLIQNIDTQQRVIDRMIVDVEEIKTINRQLTTENKKMRKDVESLNSKFNKRDFGALAAQRPQSIQRLINRASENVARCFEIASGAPLNEKELNAKTPLEANNECPNLVTNSIDSTSN